MKHSIDVTDLRRATHAAHAQFLLVEMEAARTFLEVTQPSRWPEHEHTERRRLHALLGERLNGAS